MLRSVLPEVEPCDLNNYHDLQLFYYLNGLKTKEIVILLVSNVRGHQEENLKV